MLRLDMGHAVHPGEVLYISTGPLSDGDASDKLPDRMPSTAIDQIMSMETDTMDGQARILVFLRGHLDEGRLARAVRLTIMAEPMLGYRFVDDPHRPYWKRVDEREWEPFFTMTEGSSSDLRLYRFMVDPVRPELAPQIRVGLFRSENDLICIRSNHMAVDGGGAMRYLYLLASIYRGLIRDPQYLPAVSAPCRWGPRHVLRRAGLLRAVRALTRVQYPGAEWGIPRTSDDLSRQAFGIRTIGAQRLDLLRAYARDKGVTMNDVLLTAYCRSLFTLLDPPIEKGLRVEIPTNLRRYLPEREAGTIGDLSAVYFLNLDRKPGESFEATLQRVHRDIEAKKRNQTELGELLLLELTLVPGMTLIKGLKRMADFHIAHPVISNLGIVDHQLVDFGDASVDDLRLLGPTLYPPNVGLGVSTFRQRMTLSISYCSSAMDGGSVDRLFELILNELPGAQVPDPEADGVGNWQHLGACL